MKILTDTDGNIVWCGVDSLDKEGAITVPDNPDVFIRMGKYKYENGSLVVKPYAVLTGPAGATFGQAIDVTITAYTPSGDVDTSATDAFQIFNGGMDAAASGNLVAGQATVSISSPMSPSVVSAVAVVEGKYSEGLSVVFTAS